MAAKKLQNELVASVNKAEYYDDNQIDDTSKAAYITGGAITIFTNTLLYRKGTKLLRRSGVKGFWAINGITLGVLMATNSIILGGLLGYDAARKFEKSAAKQGVPHYDKIRDLWNV